MEHRPSHVAAVRTLVESPYAPALHCPTQVELVAPAVPHLPQAHSPLHVLVVSALVAP